MGKSNRVDHREKPKSIFAIIAEKARKKYAKYLQVTKGSTKGYGQQYGSRNQKRGS